MRMLTLAAMLLTASLGFADDLKLPANYSPPIAAYAKVTVKDGQTTIRVTRVDNVWFPVQKSVAVQIQTFVDGKTVLETVIEPRTHMESRMQWRSQTVNTAAKGVSIHDTAGKPVAKDKLATLLEKETPVLISENGPVDPYYLMTAKPDTLIVVLPPPPAMPPPGVPTAPPPAIPVPAPPGRAAPLAPPPLDQVWFEMYQDRGGSHRFRIKNFNDVLAICVKGYETKVECQKVVDMIKKALGNADLIPPAPPAVPPK